MSNKRKKMPDRPQEHRDLERDIQRRNQNPISQESQQQDQGGHFGGQYEKGRPVESDQTR